MNTNYGSLKTAKNTMENRNQAAIVSVDPAVLIYTTPVTSGTDKQNDYAMSVKMQALHTVDNKMHDMINRGANADKTIEYRNRLMAAIDADTDPRHILDTLKDIYNDIGQIAIAYNILP